MADPETILHKEVENELQKLGIRYKTIGCDAEKADTSEFCRFYGFKPEQSANAIIIASKREPIEYCCCLVLAHTKLDVNRAVRDLMKIKKLSFATAEQTIGLTGMEIGGVTVFGLSEIPIYIDSRIENLKDVIIGGGNRKSKIVIDGKEFKKLSKAVFIDNLALEKEKS